jgi:hypothetical protein
MKKAQLQSGETVVVIIIVTIMIIVGLVFATRNKESSIEEEVETRNDLQAMSVALATSNLNEVRCSEYGVMPNTCMDYHRIKAFNIVVSQNLHKSKDYYYPVFGNSKIDIKILTAEPQENITLYDFNNSANKSSSPIFIPVIVRDSIHDINYFGILEVRTYS